MCSHFCTPIALDNLRRRLLQSSVQSISSHFKLITLTSQAGLIVLLGGFSGMLFHALSPIGFFRNVGPTSFVAAAHEQFAFPRVSLSDLQLTNNANPPIIIDARHTAGYAAGHIPGALSIPIDASPEQRRAVLPRLASDANIIVYCQSSGCRYADVVATSLIREGFTHVSLYPDGWIGWSNRNPSSDEQSASHSDVQRAEEKQSR